LLVLLPATRLIHSFKAAIRQGVNSVLEVTKLGFFCNVVGIKSFKEGVCLLPPLFLVAGKRISIELLLRRTLVLQDFREQGIAIDKQTVRKNATPKTYQPIHFRKEMSQ
jgi:hypothetical protein